MSRDLRAQDDLATLTLTALTLVTAVGMGRLFGDGRFIVPVMVTAVGIHGLAWGCRRIGLGALATLPVCLGGLGLIATWTVLADTTVLGIPWLGTVRAAVDSLTEANQKFGEVVAPVASDDGFILAAVLGVGLVALMADWAAFRVRSTWEAVVPAFGLFVFTSLLGADRWRWWAICGEVVAILAVICTHWARVRLNTTPWLAPPGGAERASRAGGVTPLLSGAALLTLLAVGAAVFVGPRLPGANDPPLIGVRDESDTGPGKRTTISPLVDIRGRLTERSQTEAFSVKASQRAYWRLTALDDFDGNIWSSNDSYQRAGRRLDRVGPRPPNSLEILQEFSVNELSSIWLPAAYEPTEIGGIDGVSYNSESGSAISRFPTTDGLNYTVRSERPSLTKADLSSGGALTPSSLRSHLELPPGISTRVQNLASDIVGAAGADTPFARAIALQNHLRDNFTYDINVTQGHGGSALDSFLFDTKRGYCEQFAGSYAVLARLVGLPSRVAVGFTPGDFDQATGAYRVKGIHAHAWPEVFIESIGWVLFEPTPGRGAPGAEAYTGIPEAQETAGGQGDIPATTLAPSQGGGTNPPPLAATTTTTAPEIQDSPGSKPVERVLKVIAIVLIAVLLMLALWTALVPMVRRVIRNRRRAAATTPAARVLVAWTEADEALRVAKARRRPAETLAEHARRAGGSVPAGAREALERLAGDATSASYAEILPPEVVPSALAAAEVVERAVWAEAQRSARLRRVLDPRP